MNTTIPSQPLLGSTSKQQYIPPLPAVLADKQLSFSLQQTVALISRCRRYIWIDQPTKQISNRRCWSFIESAQNHPSLGFWMKPVVSCSRGEAKEAAIFDSRTSGIKQHARLCPRPERHFNTLYGPNWNSESSRQKAPIRANSTLRHPTSSPNT